MVKWKLTLSIEPAITMPNCNNGCKTLGTIYHRMIFGTFMAVCMWRIHAWVDARGRYPVFWYDCLGTTYCDVCYVCSGFIIIYSYNDKQPVTSVFSTLNLSLQMLHFCFPVVLFFQFIIRVIVYLILSVNIHIVYVLESSMIGGKMQSLPVLRP